MPAAALRWPAWRGAAMVLAVLVVGAASVWQWMGRTDPPAAGPSGVDAPDRVQGADDAAFQLAAQCRRAMLLGQCRAMVPSAAPVPASTSSSEQRVFVAGTGEVDAAVYAAWRQQGQAMCEDVERQCRSEPGGPACRVAKALYAGTL